MKRWGKLHSTDSQTFDTSQVLEELANRWAAGPQLKWTDSGSPGWGLRTCICSKLQGDELAGYHTLRTVAEVTWMMEYTFVPYSFSCLELNQSGFWEESAGVPEMTQYLSILSRSNEEAPKVGYTSFKI